MNIRAEAEEDRVALRAVEEAAFGRADEADLVDALRSDSDLVLSLVAEADGEVAGHLALSRMEAPFRALWLGPVAVHPRRQRGGIGAELIRVAIGWAKTNGWEGIFILGEPEHYRRFGFDAAAARRFASPYAGPYFMLLPLVAELPALSGRVDYAPAFAAL